MQEAARLMEIQNGRAVTKDTDLDFMFEYQKSILLALTEQGILNEMQYRYAEEKLRDQFRTFDKKKVMRENKDNAKEGGDKI